MASSSSHNALPIPWLSLFVAALCMGATLGLRPQSEAARYTVEASLSEAEAYYVEHPDTWPDSLLRDHMGIERPERPFGGVSRVTKRRQASLDALLAPAKRALAALPEHRFALNIEAPSALGLASYAFLQPGDTQLILTAFLLLVLGIYLEPVLGRAGLAFSLVGGSLGAGLGYLQAAPLDAAPLAGATGCLAGAIAAYVVRHGRECTEGSQCLVLPIVLVAVVGPALVDGSWLLTNPLGEVAPMSIDSTGTILFGGFAGGVVAIWVAAASGLLPKATVNPQTADRHVRWALEARAAGRSREAYDLLCKVVKLRPDDSDAVATLWEVAGELGKRPQVHVHMLRVVRDEARRGELEVAARHWLELAETGVPEGAEPALLVKIADQLQRMEQYVAAVAALEAALDRPEGREPALAARAARVAGRLDPVVAERAAWLALASPELTFSDRTELEGILERVVEPATVWAHKRAAKRTDEPYGQRGPAVPLEIELTERHIELLAAVPVSLGADQVVLRVGRSERAMACTRIEAIAVSAVHGLGPRPVVVVDLVLNWLSTSDETLRVVRLRSDQFDPRSIIEGEPSQADALRSLVGRLLERSNAQALPDEESALGRPFLTYTTLEEYQRTVLMVEDLAPDKAE